ncbi:MAG TPA: PadR family transcriptional regulator, partial [Kofleriaceae bacterium]|nr:PadR family transcriptional regulator [Kofleriaceae bacterium]
IDVPYGSLDLLILKTLEGLGPLHGWGIARRIEQVSGSLLHLGQGTLYPALVRLEQEGLIRSKWGTSDNGRRARFYTLTARGTRRLPEQIEEWVRATDLIAAALGVSR